MLVLGSVQGQVAQRSDAVKGVPSQGSWDKLDGLQRSFPIQTDYTQGFTVQLVKSLLCSAKADQRQLDLRS